VEKRVHCADELGAGHHRSSSDDRIRFSLGAHPQVEILHALLRELALHEGLFGELVEEAPRHGAFGERITEGGRVLPGKEAVEVGAGATHQLVAASHRAAVADFDYDTFCAANERIEPDDLIIDDLLGVLHAGFAPSVDHGLVGDHGRGNDRAEKSPLPLSSRPAWASNQSGCSTSS